MTTSGDMNKNMGKMETSITDLQSELNVANEPSKNHFKPLWLLIALIVTFCIGAGAFLLTTRVINVDTNTQAIKRACEVRNEQLTIVNDKFHQLVELFDQSMMNRPSSQPPPTEEILKLYEKFREPIKLQDCNNQAALKGSKLSFATWLNSGG